LGVGFNTTANNAFTNGGSLLTASATDSAFHAIIGVVNSGTSGATVVDGSATSGTTGTTALTSNIFAMDAASGLPLAGKFCEGEIYPFALNSTQYGALNTNMHSATNGWNF
jgi:small ligand-binding sensory domain FIST